MAQPWVGSGMNPVQLVLVGIGVPPEGGHSFRTGAHARKVTRDAAQDGRDALAGIPMRSGSEREPPDTERVVAHAVEPASVVPQEARLSDERARRRQGAVAGG